jgi:hypothetical protein
MSSLKKIVREEIKNALIRENQRIKLRELEKNLFEAVMTTSDLKNKTTSSKSISEAKKNFKKYKIAKKIREQLETNLSKSYRKFEGIEDGEGQMLKAQLLSIMENAERIYYMIDENDTFEDWLQSKVTIAEDYLRAVNGYLKYYNGEKEMENNFDLEDDDDLKYQDSEIDDEDWDDEFGDVEDDELDYEDEDWDDEDFDDEDWDDDDYEV